jgi:hypothetical protein
MLGRVAECINTRGGATHYCLTRSVGPFKNEKLPPRFSGYQLKFSILCTYNFALEFDFLFVLVSRNKMVFYKYVVRTISL